VNVRSGIRSTLRALAGPEGEGKMNATLFRLVAAAGLALVSFALPTTALAQKGCGGPGGAAGTTTPSVQIFSEHFRGQAAEAFFESTSGTVLTDVFVHADNTLSGNTASSAEAFVEISQCDLSTGMPVLAAFGETSLTGSVFQVNTSLTSGSLNATIPVFDFVSGSGFNVTVAESWTGSGPLARFIMTSSFHTLGFTNVEHINATSRNATAAGSVSDGTTNFTPNPSTFADLASVIEGSISVSH